MNSVEDISVLLIAYKRVDGLRQILETLQSVGIKKVYITVDMATDLEGLSIQTELLKLIWEHEDCFEIFRVHMHGSNVGCAVSVLTGIDWVFKQEEFVCILEDDCLPSKQFFSFLVDAHIHLKTDSELMIACGTQFVPEQMTQGSWVKSCYPLTWGWATTRYKWSLLRKDFFQESKNVQPKYKKFWNNFFDIDYRYWQAGRRRALAGFVDVWDTILVSNLLLRNQKSLLPPSSLVTNIGNDDYATHTKHSTWTNREIGLYSPTQNLPIASRDVEIWLRDNFFQIGLRHLFTTRITQIRDVFSPRKRGPLLERWLKFQIKDL
jgi:hypothetical protein